TPVRELQARLEALQAELARTVATAEQLRTDYERERDRADTMIAAVDARAVAAEARAIAAEGRADRADARADQLVADLNALAAKMAEVLAPPGFTHRPEPEPVRPWWQRWRRRA